MRQLLLLSCAAAGCWLLWSIVREAQSNLTMLRNWKRIKAVVTGTADERSVEVNVGPLAGVDRLNVPVDAASIYSNWDKVTLLENPSNPSERRLTGLFDLWYPALTRSLALILVIATGALLWPIQIGYTQAWSSGGWVDASGAHNSSTEWVATVRPPPGAWKANLLWGAILGADVLLGAVFLGSEKHQLVRIFTGWIGLVFLGWMTWLAAENYTGVLRAGRDGLEHRSLWGTRRAAWSDIARVKLVDQSARLEKFKGLGSQGRMKPSNNAVPSIRVWLFTDSSGNELFRMDRESAPADQLGRILKLAGTRLAPGDAP